jgi:hypothetical protein
VGAQNPSTKGSKVRRKMISPNMTMNLYIANKIVT